MAHTKRHRKDPCPSCGAIGSLVTEGNNPVWECTICETKHVFAREAETKFNSRIPNCVERKNHEGIRYVSEFHMIVDDPNNEDHHIVKFDEKEIPTREQIDGWNYPIKDQYFRYTEVPHFLTRKYISKMAPRFPRLPNGNLDDRWWEKVELYQSNPELFEGIPMEEMYAFIRQEWDRRINGYWFMSNGLATHITGAHYVYLNYGRLDKGQRPDFRYIDWMVHWFWQKCVEDDYYCLGGIFPKYRRGGFTAMGLNIGLEKVTRTKSVQMGIVSKTDTDAYKAFKRLVLQFTKQYPVFWQPMRSGRDNPEERLVFAKPSRQVTKGLKYVEDDEDDGLDSEINFEATTEGAYDSQQLHYALIDETGKMVKVDAYKLWDTIKETLQQGSTVVGKAWIPSTVEELEKKGGENFKKLCTASSIKTMSEVTGQTASGLKRFYAPAEWGYEGYNDKYGFPLIDNITQEQIDWICRNEPQKRKIYTVGMGAAKVLDEKYIQQKKQGKGSLFRRKFPRKYTDCFIADGKGCLFDSESINEQLTYLDTRLKSQVFERGHLRWKNGVRFSEVEFVRDDKGMFLFSAELPPLMEANLNKVRATMGFRGTTYHPLNAHISVLGLDPYDHDGADNNDRSKAGLYGFRLRDNGIDSPDTEPENMKTYCFFMEYLHRREKAKDMWMDVLLAAWYLGARVLTETNKPGFTNWMRDIGCGDFLHSKPNSLKASDAARENKRDTSSEVGFYNTSGGNYSVNVTITEQWDLYLSENVMRIPFPNLLNQLLEWDHDNATRFDAVVGSGACLLAANTHKETRREYTSAIDAEDWETYDI